MKIKILFVALAAIAIACNDTGSKVEEASVDKKAIEDSLYKAVLEGHDVGMAKMGKIKRCLAEVQQKMDSISKLPATKIDTVYRNTLVSIRQQLNDAEGHMNHWMETFVLDSAKNDPDGRIKYLEGEKATVTVVQNKILNSLQRADSILGRK